MSCCPSHWKEGKWGFFATMMKYQICFSRVHARDLYYFYVQRMKAHLRRFIDLFGLLGGWKVLGEPYWTESNSRNHIYQLGTINLNFQKGSHMRSARLSWSFSHQSPTISWVYKMLEQELETNITLSTTDRYSRTDRHYSAPLMLLEWTALSPDFHLQSVIMMTLALMVRPSIESRRRKCPCKIIHHLHLVEPYAPYAP